jgi:hypothetical protein
MYVWRISQSENDTRNTYDSAVVVAETEELARHTFPHFLGWKYGHSDWTTPDKVQATRIGVADDPTPRVICASFNAG